MKDFKDFKEDLFKCSKCGLCQSVCPVYKVSKNECAASRGKFTILNGVQNGELALSPSVAKNLDMCLNCNACKDFCPSGIDARQIFASTRYEVNKCNLIGKFFASNSLYVFFMNIIKIMSNLYRFFALYKIAEIFEPFILKFGILGKRAMLANYLLTPRVSLKKKKQSKHILGKVVFFEGCFNRYINPSSKNATINLLNELGYEIVKMEQRCCSVQNYHAGYFKEFEENAKKIIAAVPSDVDYIVCDCATCISVLKSYDELLDEDKKIAEKVISISDLLVKHSYKKEFSENKTFTYHKPCHEDNIPSALFENIKNTQFVPLEKDSCCGVAGSFALKFQKYSRQISKDKAVDIDKTGGNYVITACPACIIGLKQGVLENGSSQKVLNVSEFLNLE